MRRIAALLALAAFSGLAHGGCPEVVRVAFFDAALPPLIEGSGTAFEASPGLLVDWVREAVRKSGCASSRLEMRRRPVQRAYRELEYNQIDLLGLAAATPANRQKAVYPQSYDDPRGGLATLRTTVSLWVRKGDTKLRWDGHRLQGLGNGLVGVPMGTATEAMAREQQWPVEAQGNGPQIVAKLAAGRIPVALVPDTTVEVQAEQLRTKLQRLGPPVAQTWYFSPASAAFAAANPDFVQRYWVALCHVARADKRFEAQRGLPACAKPPPLAQMQ